MSKSSFYFPHFLGISQYPELYTPLDTSKQEIRLCHITQKDRPNSLVNCSLRVTTLHSSPEYVALSYVWGDESVRDDIMVNGQRRSVTYNLSRALRQLQKHGPFCVWIDALCINQDDKVEKSRQVAMMGTIYRSAANVTVWLGDIPEGTSDWDRIQTSDIFRNLAEGRCLEGVKALRMSHSTYLSLAGHPLKLFRSIVDHTWFERAWVVQEAVLAKRIFFQWGYCEMPYSEFLLGAIKLSQHVTSGCCRGYFDQLAPAAKQTMEKYMQILLPLIEVRSRQGFKDWSGGLDMSDEPMTLLEALEDFRSRNAKQHCDKVYAFLGLVRSWPRGQSIMPDYTLTAQQVYINTAKHLIKSLDSLVVLTANHGKRLYTDLPSWVPDWSFGTATELPHGQYVQIRGGGNLKGPQFDYPPSDTGLDKGLYYLLDHLCGTAGNERPYRFKALYAMYEAGKNIPGWISFPSDRLLSTMGFNFEGLSALLTRKNRPELEIDKNGHSQSSRSATSSLAVPAYMDILTESLSRQPGWAEDDIVTARRWRDQFVDFRKQYMHESESADMKFSTAFARLVLANCIVPRQHSSRFSYRPVTENDVMVFNTWLEGLDDVLEALSGELVESVKHSLSYAIRNRRPFITKMGFLGLGPEWMESQDEIWVLAKAPTPVVLRPSGNGRHTYVGDAFVLNLMNGEAAEESRPLQRVFIE